MLKKLVLFNWVLYQQNRTKDIKNLMILRRSAIMARNYTEKVHENFKYNQYGNWWRN